MKNTENYKKLERCFETYKEKIKFTPEIALVLGSGLNFFAEKMKIVAELDYHDIEGFPVSTAPGHVGRYIFGYIGAVPVVCMKGRVHYYEGYPMSDVVLPIRLMSMMGAKTLIITNASGGINTDFSVGDFMIIRDQISNFVPSPLIGPNVDEFGVRFPDMSKIYDEVLINILKSTAERLDIELKEGVYIQLSGPNYETPAEIRMCKTLGADVVGMSTAVEAIAANHAGMRILGISCISNMASGISKKPLSQEEVEETGQLISEKFCKLISEVIQDIKNQT